MSAFHTSQHVTSPPDMAQQAPVWKGRVRATNHHSMRFCSVAGHGPGVASYLRRLQHGQRARHGGERLVCLLDIHGEVVGRSGGRGARLQGGGDGVGYGGRGRVM